MREQQTLTGRTIYQGRKLDLRLDEVRDADGAVHVREVVQHPGAVALVAIDAEDRVLLVRQYRPAVGQDLLELPAGTLEVGEDPQVCARRELEEETGYTADRLERMVGFYPSPGFCTEYLHVYLATGLRPGKQQPDPGEEIEVLPEPVEKALERIERGEICDAKSIIGLLAYAQHSRD